MSLKIELKELREKQTNIATQARSLLEEAGKATDQVRASELTAQYDAAMVDFDQKEARCSRLERQIEIDELRSQGDPRRPTGDGEQVDTDPQRSAEQRQKAAFNAYLRHGRENLTPEQRKSLNPAPLETRTAGPQGIATNAGGGYLVPTSFMPELIISLKAYGPMNDESIIRGINTDNGRLLPWPTMNDTANSGRRIAENTQVVDAQLTFGVLNLNAWKYTTDVVLVSSELLQDGAIDIEEVIRDAMAERLGRILNHENTLGTGSGASMPQGILTGAQAPYVTASGTAISFDDIIELEHSVDPAYRNAPGVRFQFADSTLKQIRKLKNGDGDYIWNRDLKNGMDDTINGYNYSINQDIPAIGVNNLTAVFGDHKKFVRRLVKEFAIRRLDERYADYDQVGFIGFMRQDANILDTRALSALTQAAV